MVAGLIAFFKGLAAIPKIGAMLEEVVRGLAAHFAEKRYQEEKVQRGEAVDATKKALTTEEKDAALDRWYRVGR